MKKIDWEEKLDRLIEGEVNSWILVDKKGNKFIDEMGIRWLKQYLKEDVAFWIAERLSSQLSDLKEEIKKENRYIFLTLDQPKKGESFLKLKDILSLLDKKGCERK